MRAQGLLLIVTNSQRVGENRKYLINETSCLLLVVWSGVTCRLLVVWSGRRWKVLILPVGLLQRVPSELLTENFIHCKLY